MKRRHLLLGSLAAGAPLAAARGQTTWPNKPVRFIVPFARAGTDTVSRLICDQLARSLGQTFVVENKERRGRQYRHGRTRAGGARRPRWAGLGEQPR